MSSSTPAAARSVHLWYEVPADTAVVQNTTVVNQSHPGTYVCVLQFCAGYMGVQEKYDGSKQVIFSVWDSQSNTDPCPEDRAKLIYSGEGVDVARFGNEGVGIRTLKPYDWHTGEDTSFRLTGTKLGRWSEYTAEYYDQRENSWFKIATIQTLQEKLIHYCACFIEDYRRNGESYHQSRHAHFHSFVYNQKDCTQNNEVRRARFTADNSSPVNINAGKCQVGQKCAFFLETGGTVQNTDCCLKGRVDLDE